MYILTIGRQGENTGRNTGAPWPGYATADTEHILTRLCSPGTDTRRSTVVVVVVCCCFIGNQTGRYGLITGILHIQKKHTSKLQE